MQTSWVYERGKLSFLLVFDQQWRWLTNAGIPAAARLSAGHTTEEDLQLRVQQRHIFTSEDLRHTAQDGVNSLI